MAWENLDLRCAEAANAMASKARGLKKLTKQNAEGLVTNSSSVLSHQGPTAFFLYLYAEGPSRPKKDGDFDPTERWADDISDAAYELLRSPCGLEAIVRPQLTGETVEGVKKASLARVERVGKLSESFSQVVFAKRLLDQAMTYLRYYCKTLPPGKKEKEQ
jgi:hypothetical protein